MEADAATRPAGERGVCFWGVAVSAAVWVRGREVLRDSGSAAWTERPDEPAGNPPSISRRAFFQGSMPGGRGRFDGRPNRIRGYNSFSFCRRFFLDFSYFVFYARAKQSDNKASQAT